MTIGYSLQAGEGAPFRAPVPGAGGLVKAGLGTEASFSLLEANFPPGIAAPFHIHDLEDEAFYVLEGRLRVTCGSESWVLGAGGFAYLPRGVVHQPSTEGDEPARALVFCSRPGLERFFAEVAEHAAKGGPPDLESLDRIGAPYGLRHFASGDA